MVFFTSPERLGGRAPLEQVRKELVNESRLQPGDTGSKEPYEGLTRSSATSSATRIADSTDPDSKARRFDAGLVLSRLVNYPVKLDYRARFTSRNPRHRQRQ